MRVDKTDNGRHALQILREMRLDPSLCGLHSALSIHVGLYSKHNLAAETICKKKC